MFTSNVQTAENGIAQRQYWAKIGNKFFSKMEALTPKSIPVEFRWYHLHLDPLLKLKKTTIEAPSPQKTKLTHCTTSIRPQTDSSSQEKSSSREDDKSDDKDTKDFGNNNKTPSKQQENGQNRHHKTIVPTNIKPNITIEYKLRGE